MLHPAGRDDGKTLSVGDVIIAAQGVLYAVHRPAGCTVAKGHYVVARKGAHKHHLRPCSKVFRICQAGFSVDHQALETSLAEAVVHQRGVLAEVLFHNMVHCIGNAGPCLLGRDAEGIARIQERANREQQRVYVPYLVVGLGAGDDAAAVVLAAGGGQGKNVNNRQCLLCFYFVRYQVPGIAIVTSTCSYSLRTVQD